MNNYYCDDCDAVMASRTGLIRHHKMIHPGPKAIPKNLVGCVICGQGFADQTKMMQHIVMHRADGTASKAQILEVIDQHLTPPEECVTFVIEEEPDVPVPGR